MSKHWIWAVALLLGAWLALEATPAFAQDPGDGGGDGGDGQGIFVPIEGSTRRALIPIAIPPIKSFGGDPALGAEISQIITRDLEISGYFKILPQDSFFFDINTDGLTPATINFENWTNVGASGLIKGSYKEASNQIKLDMRLFLVVKGQQANLKWEPVAVSRDKLRYEVHEFANAVIEFYTGNRGIFGTRLAFASRNREGQKHIYIVDVDGANLSRITKNDSINILPSWGGGGLYYTSYVNGNPDLFVWKGGNARPVSTQPGQNSGAAFCKGRLAVTLSKGGTNTDIYLVDPASGAIQSRLTDHWAIDTSPSWSPDCSQIAFVSDRAGTPQVYVMSAGGGEPKRLTFSGNYNTTPEWSPRGDLIAFSARDERNQFDIFTVDLDGRIARLTQDQGSNEEPTWSPDGRYLAFISSRGGVGPRIFIMTADGERQTPITNSGGSYSTPSWGR
jgi:TolB protein